MLKTLCAGVFSGMLRRLGGLPFEWIPPRSWLDSLFKGTPLPTSAGLYLGQRVGDEIDANPVVGIGCVSQGDAVCGLDICLHGFRFIFTAVTPPNPEPPNFMLADTIYRPGEFEFEGHSVFVLDWGLGA
jgi:hypothetical protein